MTCAGPLAGENPESACRAAPEGTTAKREKVSERSRMIGVVDFAVQAVTQS